MKKHLQKAMAAVVAMLTGVFSATAAPTELWMLGPAVSGNWSDATGDVVKCTNEGNGVFTYTGALMANELIIMDNNSWGGTRYAPKIANTILGDQTVEVVACQSGATEFDYHWITNDACKYKVTVTFADNGNATIAAEKVQETAPIPENLYMVGPATAAGWDINNAIQMTGDGKGKFTY